MKYREYILSKKNRMEILVIDKSNTTGFSMIIINKDLYIELLESGARKLEKLPWPLTVGGKKRIVYRKGLGILVHDLYVFVDRKIHKQHIDRQRHLALLKMNAKKREEA